MILQKIRAFFEWLGKRSTAKSRKALDYEWTTMGSEGAAPVKTVNLDEPAKPQSSIPVKTVELEEVKVEQVPQPEHAEVVSTERDDTETKMSAILKVLTIRDTVDLLQGKFEKAADVRRSRVALLAFLQQMPEAVQFLEEKVKEKKAEKKPAKKTVARTKTAKSSAAKKPIAETDNAVAVSQDKTAEQSDAQQQKTTSMKKTTAKVSPRKVPTKKTAAKKATQGGDVGAEVKKPVSRRKPAAKKVDAKPQTEVQNQDNPAAVAETELK